MASHSLSGNVGMMLLKQVPPSCSLPKVPVVGRIYESSMLRPPNTAIGERECVNGPRCMCRHLGALYHGNSSPLAFVCVEFILPEEQRAWQKGQRLPEVRKKCLMCLRYWAHVQYLLLRSDPTFRADMCGYQLLSHCNKGSTIHTNNMESSDGYPMSMMLFSDEMNNAKSEGADPLNWFPFVGFSTHHYQWTRDRDDNPIVKQIIPANNADLNGSPSNA